MKYDKQLIAEIIAEIDKFHANYPIVSCPMCGCPQSIYRIFSSEASLQSPIANHVVDPTTPPIAS